MCNLNSSSLCNLTYSQIPGRGMWTSCRERGEGGRGPALFCLPQPVTYFKFQIGNLLVIYLCWSIRGAITKYNRLGNHGNLFPAVLEAEPRSRFWQIWCLVWARLLGDHLPWCPHMVEGNKGALWGLCYKSIDPIHEDSTFLS